MLKLDRNGYERARQFLLTQARPLERELFRYHFETWKSGRVVAELLPFANDDGGFGHAFEPDCRSPSSSALATSLGLQTLRVLGRSSVDPPVVGALQYLMETCDPSTHVWRPVPLDVNDYPHAPWWHDQDGSLERSFDRFRLIPRVQILAGLWHYEDIVPREWLDQVTRETLLVIESEPRLGEGGGSDLEYCLQLAQAEPLPEAYRERLLAVIQATLGRAVVRDEARWGEYCLTPLRIIDGPDTPGEALVDEAVQRHLDYQIQHQSADGSWEPTWSWAAGDESSWAQARREWCGVITLRTLRQLAAFGRLEKD